MEKKSWITKHKRRKKDQGKMNKSKKDNKRKELMDKASRVNKVKGKRTTMRNLMERNNQSKIKKTYPSQKRKRNDCII